MHLIILSSLSDIAYVVVNPTMRWGETAAHSTRNLLKRSRAMVAGQRLTGRHPALQHHFIPWYPLVLFNIQSRYMREQGHC